MEMNIVTVALTLVSMAIVSSVWKILNWVWWRPKKLEKYLNKQGIRGTSYKLLFGDIKRLSPMQNQAEKSMSFSHDYVPRLLPFLHETLAVHGKNPLTWMGPIPVINITEVELVREVLSKIYDFQKPKMFNPLIKLLVPSLISYDGDQWAQHRKLVNPAFHLSKLKPLMVPAFCTSCAEMLNKWEKVVNNKEGRYELDVRPYIETLTADAISQATFGGASEEGTRVFKLLEEQIVLVSQMFRSIYIPGSRFLPTKMNKRMEETEKEIQKLLQKIISARKKALLEGSESDAVSTKDDFLSTLMESISDEQQLIDDCKLFYFAGKDSTSMLLVWTMILLSKHQDWQASARQEVLSVFGHTNQPHFEGLNHLNIVTMILYEVLRLYPPATTLRRYVPKETKLGSLSLPAGTLITLPLVFIHHDPEVWGEDAKEFNPERFSQGIPQATKSGKPSLIAFSTGPRNCIGRNYALIEVKLELAMILQRFSFELSPSYIHAPTVTLGLHPKYGAPIILRL